MEMNKIILKRTENYNDNKWKQQLFQNLVLILEYKINAFWESSNWGPHKRRTLTKDKSDRFNKV